MGKSTGHIFQTRRNCVEIQDMSLSYVILSVGNDVSIRLVRRQKYSDCVQSLSGISCDSTVADLYNTRSRPAYMTTRLLQT